MSEGLGMEKQREPDHKQESIGDRPGYTSGKQ